MLEAVVSQDLWIWHAFFKLLGANNDLNVLYQSNLFDNILDDVAPECPFTVNGNTYNWGYYLADGIYPTCKVVEDEGGDKLVVVVEGNDDEPVVAVVVRGDEAVVDGDASF
nr:hypothetical protein [Tanacetum cinerariifolium]